MRKNHHPTPHHAELGHRLPARTALSALYTSQVMPGMLAAIAAALILLLMPVAAGQQPAPDPPTPADAAAKAAPGEAETDDDSTAVPAAEPKPTTAAETTAAEQQHNRDNEAAPAATDDAGKNDNDDRAPFIEITNEAREAPSIFEFRDQGDDAFAAGLYDVAERFYYDYWKGAYDQDVLVDSAVRLVKSLIAQEKITEAFAIIAGIPDDIAALNRSQAPSNAAVVTDNNDVTVRFWRAKLLHMQDDVAAAQTEFEGLVERPIPESMRVQVHLALSECHISTKNWAAAETELSRISELVVDESDRLRARLAAIQIAIAQDRFDEADRLISAEWDGAADAYRVRLGLMRIAAFLSRAQPAEAFAFFRANLEDLNGLIAAPADYLVMRSLGLALLEDQQYEPAVLIFSRILPLALNEKEKKEILLDLAGTHDAAAQTSAAIQYYTRYLTLYPTDALVSKIQLRVAQLFEVEMNVDEALTYYLRVYENEENWPPFRYQASHNIGWIYRKQKIDHEKAIKYFFESSTLDVTEDEQAVGVFFAAETYLLIADYNNAALHYQSVADKYAASAYAEEARYKQAQARFEGRRYRMSADNFTQYLSDWPDGKFAEVASLYKGISERLTGDFKLAIDTLQGFVKHFPESADAPRAFVEISEAAVAANIRAVATDSLGALIDRYADSELYPYALYKRAYLHLTYGFYTEARKGGFTFLDKFAESHPELASDVYLWLGDHFANNRDFGQAEHLFMEAVRRYQDSPDAPVALYEAAKCAYQTSRIYDTDYNKALTYIVQLLSGYPDAPDRIIAQANFLRGDIDTINGNFREAIGWFKTCSELVPKTDLYYAAMGRLGECYYSLASVVDQPAEYYQNALSYFDIIMEAKEVKHAQVEMARYRAAKVYENLNQPEKARDQYHYIFFRRDYEERNKRIFDWYYYARAGIDLARMYVDKGDYTSARTIYNRLARSNIPISEDARTRADELDAIYLAK